MFFTCDDVGFTRDCVDLGSDVVVWDRHEGVVSSITGDMVDVREDSAVGRVWRLPVAGLMRR